MIIIEASTADQVYIRLFDLFCDSKVYSVVDSRNGRNKEILHFALQLNDPKQRFITSRNPPINIAFALVEVVWIIRGRKDAKFLNYWNSTLSRYAGDSPEYHGAYGYRIRKHLGIDQLELAYNALKEQNDSRQVVLQIWDSAIDLPRYHGQPESKDIPCNVLSMIKVRGGKLEWTQIMRSNDYYRGLPYNVIQFTMLQEILSGWLGLGMGAYVHYSDSMHSYLDDINRFSVGSSLQQYAPLNMSMSKRESDNSFIILEQCIERLINEGISQKEILEEIDGSNLNGSYNDFLLILAAECSRKHNWNGLSNDIIMKVNNKEIQSMWLNWAKYLSEQKDKKNY